MNGPAIPNSSHDRSAESVLSRWEAFWRITFKELLEILRDRRTIITLVMMPLMLYPLLAIMFRQYFLASFAANQPKIFRIATNQEVEFRQLMESARPGVRWADIRDSEQLLTPDSSTEPQIMPIVIDDPATIVRSGDADIGIMSIRPIRTPQGAMVYNLAVCCMRDSSMSQAALEWLQDRVQLINKQEVDRTFTIINQRNGTSFLSEAVRIRSEELDKNDPRKPMIPLTSVIPLVLILMTITGAVYPAIDLTAGERERGTLEVLVSAPVTKLTLLLAKYIAVFVVAVLTAAVNLAMMLATITFSELSTMMVGPSGFSFSSILLIMLLMCLFAAFYSAVLLAITSFARSFKEAQAYLIPLMLVSLAPGVASLMPGLELRGLNILLPLLNVVLLSRDLLAGHAGIGIVVVVVLINAVYCAVALWVASKTFGAESVLFSDHIGWKDFLKRPRRSSANGRATSALLCTACLFPIIIFSIMGIQQLQDWTLTQRLILAGLVQMVVTGIIPLLTAIYSRVQLQTGFRVFPASPLAFIGAALLGISLSFIGQEIIIILIENKFGNLTKAIVEAKGFQLREITKSVQPWLLILMLGILPPITEEFLFRGLLFSSLSDKRQNWGVVITTGLIFGFFHLITNEGMVERFVASTLLGFVLGWVAWMSQSVFPSMVQHMLHNSVILIMGYYHQQFQSVLERLYLVPAASDQKTPGKDVTEHLPPRLLLVAAVVASIGAVLVWLGRSRARVEAKDADAAR